MPNIYEHIKRKKLNTHLLFSSYESYYLLFNIFLIYKKSIPIVNSVNSIKFSVLVLYNAFIWKITIKLIRMPNSQAS